MLKNDAIEEGKRRRREKRRKNKQIYLSGKLRGGGEREGGDPCMHFQVIFDKCSMGENALSLLKNRENLK